MTGMTFLDWFIKHKTTEVMCRREAGQLLIGRVYPGTCEAWKVKNRLQQLAHFGSGVNSQETYFCRSMRNQYDFFLYLSVCSF